MPNKHIIQPKRPVGRPRKRYHIPVVLPPRRLELRKVTSQDTAVPPAADEADVDDTLDELRAAGVDVDALERASEAYHADLANLERLRSHADRKKYYVGKTDAEANNTRKCVEVIKTWEIPFYMDCLQQDLLSKRVSIGHAVKQTWHGPASDTPKDIRARQFTLAFRDDFPETEKFIARTDPQIVFRAEFHCAGTHNRCDDEPPSAADLADAIDHLEYSDDDEPWDGMSDNAEQADVDENPDPAPDPKETPKEAKDQRRTRCTGNSRTCVQYHFEIMSDELYTTRVWQVGEHPAVNTKKHELRPSRFLRNRVLDYIKTIGSSAKSIYRDVVLPFTNGSDKFPFPEYRTFTEPQVNSLYANCRHRDQLDINSFRAVTKIAELNPDSVFCYTPLDEARSHTFTVGLKSNSSLESIMLHYRPRGLCIDASWRNKNENRAAVTNIIAINEGFHFTPGASFISASTSEATIEQMLRTLSHEIVERAKVLCADITQAEHTTPEERDALLREAKLIVEQGFEPSLISLDKDLAQFNAVRKVWPGARPRICQFHVLQAVRRKATDDGSKFPGALGFTQAQDKALACAIRELQRVKTEGEIDDYKQHFFDDLLKLCLDPPTGEGGDVLAEWDFAINEGDKAFKSAMDKFNSLKAYFVKNWLTPQWMPYWTDLGLPGEQTRDHNNVNNFAESAFKVFDGVFLGHRKNKRVDRLVLQIMDMFNYYQAIRPKFHDTGALINIDEAYIKLTLAAHGLWEKGLITDEGHEQYLIRLQVKVGEKKVLKQYRVQANQSQCTCTRFRQTGKLCSHLQAARLYRFAGPAEYWIEQESASDQGLRNLSARKSQKHAAPPPGGPSGSQSNVGGRRPRRETDEVAERKFYAVMGHLADDAAQRLDDEDKRERSLRFWDNNQRGLRAAHAAALVAQDWDDDDGLLNTAGTTRGRPRATSPLHPGRKKKRRRQSSRGESQSPTRNGNGSKVRFRDQPTRRRPGAPPAKSKGTTSTSKSKSSARPPAAEVSSAKPSTSGSFSTLASQVVTRWDSESGGLGVPEMDMCIDLCNILSARLGRRILFMRSPGSKLAGEVEVQWHQVSVGTQTSLEDTPVHLRGVHPSRQNTYDAVVFIHLYAKTQDFCLFEYSPDAHRSEAIKAINPGNYQVLADVSRICRLGEFFRADRNQEKSKTAYTSTGYTTRRLALDSSKGASGFWCIWLALCRILGVTLHEDHMRIGGIVQIKERLFRLYQTFVAHPEGLRRWVLEDAMEGLGIDKAVFTQPSQTEGQPLIKVAPNDIIAARDRTYGEAVAKFERGLVYEETLARSLDTLIGQMPNTMSILDNACAKEDVTKARHHDHLHPDLFKIAIHAIRRMDTCANNKIYIATVETTGRMYAAPFSGRSSLKPPTNHGSEEWIPDVNIFEQKLLVLPFSFIKPNGRFREFHVGIVDMQVGTIYVLSPKHEQHMHGIMVERVRKMIAHEKNVRGVTRELEFQCLPSAKRKMPAQASRMADCAFVAFGYISALVKNPSILPFHDACPMRSNRMRALRLSLLSRVGEIAASEVDNISWSPPADTTLGGEDAATALESNVAPRPATTSRTLGDFSQASGASGSHPPIYDSDARSSSAGPSYSMAQSHSSPGPSTFDADFSIPDDSDPHPDRSPTPSPATHTPTRDAALSSNDVAVAERLGPGIEAASSASHQNSLTQPALTLSPAFSHRRSSPEASSSAMDVDTPGHPYPSSSPTALTMTDTHANACPGPSTTGSASTISRPEVSGPIGIPSISASTNPLTQSPVEASLTEDIPSSTIQSTDPQDLTNADFPTEIDQDIKDKLLLLLVKQSLRATIMTVKGAEHADGTVLTRDGLHRLVEPGEWINDEVVNAWRAILKVEMNARGLANKICVMNTQFYVKLSDPFANQTEELSRWLTVDIFAADFEKLVVPVNLGNRHWVVVCINFQNCRIDYYDSCSSARPTSAKANKIVMERFESFLSLHYLRMRRQERTTGVYNPWVWAKDLHIVEDFPQQVGDNDCGVFATVAMRWLCLGGVPYRSFEQRKVDAFRVELARRFMSSTRKFEKSKAIEKEVTDSPADQILDAGPSDGASNSGSAPSSSSRKSSKRKIIDDDNPSPEKRPRRSTAEAARRAFANMDNSEEEDAAEFIEDASPETSSGDESPQASRTGRRSSRKNTAKAKPARAAATTANAEVSTPGPGPSGESPAASDGSSSRKRKLSWRSKDLRKRGLWSDLLSRGVVDDTQ